jgi:hypothetical protein
MKRILLFLTSLFLSIYSYAQGEIDALRISGTDLQGTARGQAMGGAFGALGGDVTGVLINPAGLGIYNVSEVNATFEYSSANIETDWTGTTTKQDKSNFKVNNVSYIGYYPTRDENVSLINFGFSYRRLKDFNRRYSASGSQITSSLSSYIAALTNNLNNFTGIDSRDLEPTAIDEYAPYYRGIPWLSVLGWQGALIDPSTNVSPIYKYKNVLRPGESVDPSLNVNESGGIETYDFSLGTNINDILYLGVTFSLTNITYVINSYYKESLSTRDNFDLTNYLATEGGGYQFRLGAILRPVDFLRLGIAYYSPTWYSLTDYFSAKSSNTYNPGFSKAKTPPDEYYPYRFKTPDTWVFSIAGILGSQAIISADCEFKNYSKMNIQTEEGREAEDNQFIQKDFRLTSSVRAGLEYRFTPRFSGRLGYAWMQHPYEADFKEGLKEVMIIGTIPHYTVEGDAQYFTAGLGYRITPNVYIDVTFVNKNQTDKLYAYSSMWNEQGEIIVNSKPISFKNNVYNGLLTIGYKF